MRFYNLTRIVLTIYRRLSVDLPNNHIDTQLCNLEITMPLLISCRFLVIMCSSLPSIFLARRSTTLHMQVSFMCFRISQLMDIPLVALSAIFIAGMLHKAPLRWLFTFFYVQWLEPVSLVGSWILFLCSALARCKSSTISLPHITHICTARTCLAYLDRRFYRCASFRCVVPELNLADNGLAHRHKSSTLFMGK